MRVTIPAIFALAACGGGGSALEGIYTVDAWTSNPTSCADPGPSTIATHEPMVYAKKKSLFGQSFLAVDDCTDPADCSTGAAEQGIGYFFFDHGNDDDGWVGTIVFESGPDLDNMCSGGVVRATLTGDAGTAFGVRSETIESAPFAPNGSECTTDDAEAAADGQPCARVETMHATFSADLQ
jgi:hypothetical protein